ncbi:HvfC family RiPP maturation protein [Elongatibacter sediminis]|uniref:DNA-binding domain-containing protein n=1 Tax=Elongatibacter sediminis TaxID=3119006 RepID=A0AAW9R667_9GAMM
MNSDSAPERLARLQSGFAGHIRDPEGVAAPADIEDRRMEVYRDLFFRNISGLLASNFPVTRKLYDDDGWKRLVREFFIEHRAHTPLFPELPKEFLRYLQDFRNAKDGDPPFLLELAHYEWIELALSLDTRELDEVTADPQGDLIAGVPVLSPLAWPLSYRYPVHRIAPDFRPDRPGDQITQLLVYRNRRDQVRFMQLNDVTQLLLHLMSEDPQRTGHELLLQVAERIAHPDPAALVGHGKSLLDDLKTRDVILGTQPVPNSD